MDLATAMDLVGYVEWAASVCSDRKLGFLCGLEVPDGVLIFGVLEQLFGGHGSHGAARIDAEYLSALQY